MVVYSVRVAVIGQSTNNNKNEIGLIQIPKRYYIDRETDINEARES